MTDLSVLLVLGLIWWEFRRTHTRIDHLAHRIADLEDDAEEDADDKQFDRLFR